MWAVECWNHITTATEFMKKRSDTGSDEKLLEADALCTAQIMVDLHIEHASVHLSVNRG